jgi:hypothetical protein
MGKLQTGICTATIMIAMKTFDWAHAATLNTPDWLAWLKANHDKPITCDEFVAAYCARRDTDSRPYKAKRYYVKRLVRSYEKLKSDFGFFQLGDGN